MTRGEAIWKSIMFGSAVGLAVSAIVVAACYDKTAIKGRIQPFREALNALELGILKAEDEERADAEAKAKAEAEAKAKASPATP